MNAPGGGDFEYDVALSFAGADRRHAEALASLLKASNVRVFYDADEKANLWGQDLYVYLYEVYRRKARFCIVFVSADYAEKVWTNHERQAAQERALKERGNAYILPIRLDDTSLPGLPQTIASVDIAEGIPAIANLVIEKANAGVKVPLPTPTPPPPPRLPRGRLAASVAIVLFTTATVFGVIKFGAKAGRTGPEPTADVSATPPALLEAGIPSRPTTSVGASSPQIPESTPPPDPRPPSTRRTHDPIDAADGLDWLRAAVNVPGVTFALTAKHDVVMKCVCLPLPRRLGPYGDPTSVLAREAIRAHALNEGAKQFQTECKACQ